MNWLSPVFLVSAAAIALPLALHLLRRRATRVVAFPALRFLNPNQPRSRHQNAHRRLVLALRCLVLALLAAAFARPFFGDAAPIAERATIVVIDNSFSLHAPGRWEELKTWALAELGRGKPGDLIGLLLMNPRPSWLVQPTRDADAALAALNDLRPGWETTRAGPAVRFAADFLAHSPARVRKIICLGDHQALGWAGVDFSQTLPSGVTAIFPPVPNTSFVRQAALQSPTLVPAGESLTATVVVRNFGKAGTQTLRLFAGDARVELHTESIDLAAGESRAFRHVLPASALSAGWVRFALDADELPADDEAWAVVPAESATQRLLMLDRSPSENAADPVNIACQSFADMPPGLRLAEVPATRWPAPAAAILRNEASFAGSAAARLDHFLAAGGSAMIFLDGSRAQLGWLAAHGIVPTALSGDSARVSDWAMEHPFVAPLAEANLRGLIGWTFKRGWALPADRVEPVAFWADGSPALGELRIGSGHVMIAGFTAERRDGEWPLAPAFVPFLHRTALHLLNTGPHRGETATVGKPLALPQGAAGAWRALAGPASTRPPTPVSDFVLPDSPGVYEWTREGERRLVAINLPEDESNLAPWSEGTPWNHLASGENTPAPASMDGLRLASQEAERQSPLWWWCFAVMAVFSLVELGFANRTTR